MANQRIDVDVGLKIDKTGLNQIKSSLQEIKNLTAQDLMKIGGHNDIKQAQGELDSLKRSISQIDGALEKAFNTDLGTLNVSKFNQALKGMNLNQVYKDFSAAGAAGQSAFRNITSQILTTNMQLKQTHNFLNNMATTMANTVKWGVASSVMNNFTGSVQKAYGYVKSLDSSLNDIRIVTNKSAEEMDKFAVKANNAAKALGKSTTDYTDASLIYYQQGLSDKEVAARAETTLKAANVTGQSGEAVSEQLTAVWNGYKVSAEEAELYIDKLAAVAATTASDLEELSTGMSKVASAANLMGVDIDSLNAQMATIVSVTRQAPESVGTALKTIYARMGDIEAGLDAETTLGNYTEEMKAMGVNVLDANGKLRDMGDVINEIGGNWKNMTREQQLSLSQTMAGTRQYNNLLSLFDNWDMYTEALNTSANAAGTLQKQQDTYMESTQAHLNQLRAASEDLYDSLLDPKGLNPLIDGLTTITNLFSNFVDSIGGGSGVLLALGSIGTKVFSQQLASGIATFITNMQNAKENANQLRAEMEILSQFQAANLGDAQVEKLVSMKQRVLDLDKSITNEERNIANEYINQQNNLYQQQDDLQNRLTQAKELYTQLTGESVNLTGADNAANQNLAKQLMAESDDLNSYKGNLKATEDAVNSFIRIEKQYADVLKSGNQATEEGQQVQERYSNALRKAKDEIKNNVESATDLVKSNRLDVKSRNELVAVIENYNKATQNGKKVDLDNISVLNASKNVRETYNKVIQDTQYKIKQAAQDLENHTEATKRNGQATTNLQKDYGNFLDGIDLRAKIQQSIQLVSSFGQLASAFNTIKNLGSIWSNEDLTVGEKMLQTVTNLGFAIPMLLNSLGKVNEVLGIGTSFTQAKTAAIIAETAATNGLKLTKEQLIAVSAKENAINTISYGLKQKGVSAETAYRAALLQSLGTETVVADVKKLNAALAAGTLTVKDYEIKINALLSASNIKLATSEFTAAAGAKAFLTALGPIAIIFAAVGAVSLLVAAFEKAHISAKEAGEAVSDSLSELESSTTELENLESALQGVQDKLDELYSKDELSITDKEDIANLERERIELETQLALQKEINAEKQKGVVSDVKQALDKGTYDYEGRNKQSVIDAQGNASSFDATSEETKDAWVEGQVARYGENFRDAAEQLADKYYQQYHGEITSQMMEDLDSLQSALDAATATGDNDTADKIKAKIEEIYNSTGMLDDTVLSSMNSVFQGDTTQQNQFHEALQSGDPTAASGWTDEDLAKAGLAEEQIEALKVAADAAGTSLDTLVNTYKELGNEEVAGTFENNLNKIRTGIEGAGVEYDRGSVMRPSMEGVATSTLHQLQDEYGVDDNFMNKALENLDYSKIDYNNFREGFELALRQAIESQQNTEVLSEQELFTQDTEEKGAKYAEEYGIDAEQFENVTKLVHNSAEEFEGFSEELKENGEAAQEVAKELLRYDKALEDVGEHYEDWMDILKGDNLQDQADIIDDLSDAYGNLLDMDGSQLSAGFLQSTKNLELMKEAANGSEEAYKSLQEAAGQDILAQVGIDKSQYATDLAEINNMAVNAENQGLADVEAGASLDNTQFLNALSQMVTSAGMTAAQATNYLSSMGIDAEVETEDQTVSEVVGHNVRAHTFTTYQTYSPGANPDGSPMTSIATYPEVMYSTEPITVQKRVAGTGLKVTSANKSSGGGVKFNNSSHGGGSKGGGKKSGGGGGGKKGGGSTPTKTYKQSAKTKNRYHDVDNKLSKLTNDLDKLTEAQDRLFGSDLLKNLNKQLDVIERQVSATKEKLQIARAEAKEMRKQKLKNQEPGYYNDFKDFGVNFNSSGEITNALDLMAKWDDKVESLTNSWNALTAKQQEGAKGEEIAAALEQAEANRDTLNKLIEDYNDLIYDTIPGLESKIQEQANLQLDIKLQIFQIEAELRLDLTEAYEEWYDFQRELTDFKMFADFDNKSGLLSAEAQKLVESARLFRDEYRKLTESGLTETLTGDLEILEAELRDIRNHPKTYSGQFAARDDNGNILKENGKVAIDQQAILDAMGGSITDLEEHLTNVKGVQQDLFDNLLESIDLLQESYEQQYETLEFVGDQIDYNLSMMELMGSEDYATMAGYYQDMADNAKDMTNSTRNAMNYYKKQMERDDITEEEREKFRELYMQAANDYQEALVAEAEIAQAQFENSVKQQAKAIRDALGTDKAEMKWELEIDKDDDYLDTVNSAFEKQSFKNKIQEQINNTDSLSAQKKLNDLMDDELEKLEKKGKLTQYDIDRANQMLEIELKRIALEEAQNNKSQMRLRRDSSGNYSYQFVADEDSKAQAEQELNEAQNSLYNMDKEELQARNQEMLDIARELEESMLEYASLGAEERAAKEAEYQAKWQYLKERQVQLAKETEGIELNLAQSTYDSMKTLYDQDAKNFSGLNKDQVALLKSKNKTFEDLSKEERKTVQEKMLPTWTTSLDSMKKAVTDKGGFQDVFTTALGKIKTANKKCTTKLTSLKTAAKTAYDTAKTKTNQWYEKQKLQTKEIKKSIKDIRSAKTTVDGLAKSWQSVYDNAVAALKSAKNYKNYVTKKEADKVGESKKSGGAKDNKDNKGNKDSKPSNNPNKSSKPTWKRVKAAYDHINKGHWGVTLKKRIKEGKKDGFTEKEVRLGQDLINYVYPKNKGGKDYSMEKAKKIMGYDTGGYTGKWPGKEGKIALLHSKELVLNAKDTENILSAVSLIREVQMEAKKVSSSAINKKQDSIEGMNQICKELLEGRKLSSTQIKQLDSLNRLSKENLTTFEKDVRINYEKNSELLKVLDTIKKLQNEGNKSLITTQKLEESMLKHTVINTRERAKLEEQYQKDLLQLKKVQDKASNINSKMEKDNPKESSQLADQVSKARNHLYKLRTVEFTSLIDKLTSVLSVEKDLRTNLNNIKKSALLKDEVLSSMNVDLNTARKSLYSLRHTDFEKLLAWLETGKLKGSNISSANKGGVASAEKIDKLKNISSNKIDKLHADILDDNRILQKSIGTLKGSIKDTAQNLIQSNIRSIVSVASSRLNKEKQEATYKDILAPVKDKKPTKESIRQDVKVNIDANFPNVEDMNEIINALDGLINDATQHAYSTLK